MLAWNKVKEGLIRRVEEIRDRRLLLLLLRRAEERRRIIDMIYNSYKAARTPFQSRMLPQAADLCTLPELRHRIEAGIDVEATIEAFSDIEEHLPMLILSYEQLLRREAEAALGQVWIHGQPTGPINFDFAANALACCGCNTVFFGWSELQEHRCTLRVINFDPGSKLIQSRHPTRETKPFRRLPKSITHQVIRLAGLYPDTATIADMDTADLSYFCPPCLVHYVPDALQRYYTWRSIVSSSLHLNHFTF